MIAEYSFVLLFADYIFDGGTVVPMKCRLDCATLCGNTLGCSSFFYSRNLGSCLLSSTRHVDTGKLTPRAGYGYFKMTSGFGSKCVSTRNCRYKNALCKEATCECEMGFSYDPRNESCVKKCSQFGDSYATYREHSIDGYNWKSISVSKPEDCIQACINDKSFVCISAEVTSLDVSKNCNLNKFAWFELRKGAAGEEKNWVTFYRHCAA